MQYNPNYEEKGIEGSLKGKKEDEEIGNKRNWSLIGCQQESNVLKLKAKYHPWFTTSLSDDVFEKQPSVCTKIRLFYTSPAIKFILNTITYLVFLGMFKKKKKKREKPLFTILEHIKNNFYLIRLKLLLKIMIPQLRTLF